MKIAFISDIHGNTPALEKVLSVLKEENIEYIYCLGDIIGKGPNPEEATQIIKTACKETILGNWEDFMLHSPIHEMPIDWYRKNISENSWEFYKNLKYQINLSLGGFNISAFHAHPEDVYKRTQQSHPENKKRELFQKSAQVAIYADIHYQYIEQISKHKILMNTGSVGNPLDTPRAKYLILEGEPNHNVNQELPIQLSCNNDSSYILTKPDNSKLRIKFCQQDYDIKKAVELAEKSDMPEKHIYISETQTAIHRMVRRWKTDPNM